MILLLPWCRRATQNSHSSNTKQSRILPLPFYRQKTGEQRSTTLLKIREYSAWTFCSSILPATLYCTALHYNLMLTVIPLTQNHCKKQNKTTPPDHFCTLFGLAYHFQLCIWQSPCSPIWLRDAGQFGLCDRAPSSLLPRGAVLWTTAR